MAIPSPCTRDVQGMHKGCTPDAHRMHTGKSLVHPVCILCTSGVHPVCTARSNGEAPWVFASRWTHTGIRVAVEPRILAGGMALLRSNISPSGKPPLLMAGEIP